MAGEVTPPRLMIDGCDVRSKAGVLNRREAPHFPVWAKQATPQEETVVRWCRGEIRRNARVRSEGHRHVVERECSQETACKKRALHLAFLWCMKKTACVSYSCWGELAHVQSKMLAIGSWLDNERQTPEPLVCQTVAQWGRSMHKADAGVSEPWCWISLTNCLTNVPAVRERLSTNLRTSPHAGWNALILSFTKTIYGQAKFQNTGRICFYFVSHCPWLSPCVEASRL